MRHEGVTGFVVGEDALLLFGDDAALLETRHDALHRRIEVLGIELVGMTTPGGDGGLVGDVGEVGAGETCRLPGDRLQVHTASGFPSCAPRGSPPADEIGWRHEHPPIKAAGTEEGRIEVLQGLDAPMTTTRSSEEKPSSSTSSWLRVWSCSRLKPWPVRAAPTASSSSMKTIAGACLRAELADSCRAEAGEHLYEGGRALREERSPDPCATAFASSVFPVLEAREEDPLGTRAPSCSNASDHGGSLRQLDLDLGQARHVVPGDGRARPGRRALRVDLGVSFTTRQRKYTIRHISASGSQIRSIPPTSSRIAPTISASAVTA